MIKKDDILIYIPQAYRRYNAHIYIEPYSQVVAYKDQDADGVHINAGSQGQGMVDASCVVHKECYDKMMAYQMRTKK